MAYTLANNMSTERTRRCTISVEQLSYIYSPLASMSASVLTPPGRLFENSELELSLDHSRVLSSSRKGTRDYLVIYLTIQSVSFELTILINL